jgi:hypothetical protein
LNEYRERISINQKEKEADGKRDREDLKGIMAEILEKSNLAKQK